MTRVTILLCALALTAVAAAQQARPIQVAPVQSAPAQQAAQVQPRVDDAAKVKQEQAPTEALDTVESLRAANQKLRVDIRELRRENAELKQRLLGYTELGGSTVTAYCPSATVSRNTAGAERDCAAGGYACDKVSGQCRTTCAVSTDCATGYSCNPCNQRCESNAGPITTC